MSTLINENSEKISTSNVQQIIVPLDGSPPFEYVIAKEGDINSRIVEITLTEHDVEYVIPEAVTARVKYYKPDGETVLNDCEIKDNKVIVTYTEQMLVAAGTGYAEIVLYSDNTVLTSATFYTKIVKSVYKANGLVSDSEHLSLNKILIETTQARDSANAATKAAEVATDNAEAATRNTVEATANAEAAAKRADTAATNADMATESAEAATQNTVEATANAKAAAKRAATAAVNTENAINEAKEATKKADTATTTANEAAETAIDAAKSVFTDRNYDLLVNDDGSVTLMYDEKEEEK